MSEILFPPLILLPLSFVKKKKKKKKKKKREKKKDNLLYIFQHNSYKQNKTKQNKTKLCHFSEIRNVRHNSLHLNVFNMP